MRGGTISGLLGIKGPRLIFASTSQVFLNEVADIGGPFESQKRKEE